MKSKTPKISVVIPLLNERESLPELFDWIALVMQSNRFLYEVVFVDDGSTDKTAEICSGYKNIKLITNHLSLS